VTPGRWSASRLNPVASEWCTPLGWTRTGTGRCVGHQSGAVPDGGRRSGPGIDNRIPPALLELFQVGRVQSVAMQRVCQRMSPGTPAAVEGGHRPSPVDAGRHHGPADERRSTQYQQPHEIDSARLNPPPLFGFFLLADGVAVAADALLASLADWVSRRHPIDLIVSVSEAVMSRPLDGLPDGSTDGSLAMLVMAARIRPPRVAVGADAEQFQKHQVPTAMTLAAHTLWEPPKRRNLPF